MRDDDGKTKDGATLWGRARPAWQAPRDDEAPEALLLASYLDGHLGEEEAARLEARLAAEPALLDELLALRAGLAEASEPAPAGVVARARAAYAGRPAARRVEAGKASFLDRLFGAWLRPAVPAFAAVMVLLACAGAFELGRYQGERLDSTQTAGLGDSDVPVDLLMGGLL